MKKWIRWKGVVPFLAVVIIFSALWRLLIGGMVERTIEKMGTKAVGAKVEIAEADVSLFPAGLELIRLQVTDPDEPMQNAIEVARINLAFNPLHLFERKLVAEKMVLDGVAFNTQRQVSGAIKGVETPAPKKHPERIKDKFKQFPGFALKDVQQILKNETLLSLEQAKRLQDDIDAEKENFQKRLDSLPTKDTFEEYRRRLDELTAGGKGALMALVGKSSEIRALKKEIETDIHRIKKTRKALTNLQKSLRARVDKVIRSPLDDVKRIKEKYALTPQGLANMSAVIFGPQYADWVQKGLSWYAKLRPFLARAPRKEGKPEVIKPVRGKGVNVRFKEYAPKPDFLIRQARSSIVLQAGALSGMLRNITADQDILGKPLTYEFSSEKLTNIKELTIYGSLNRVLPDSPKDTINARLAGGHLKKLNLTDNLKSPLILENAMLNDLQLAAIIQGEKITSKLACALSSVRFLRESRPDEDPVLAAIQSALAGINEFNLTADIIGTLNNPEITLSSDLDEVLRATAQNAVKKQTAMFESQLKQAIAAKTDGQINNLKQRMADFNAFDQDLEARMDLGANIMKDFRIFGK